MIRFILYVLVASACVFAFVYWAKKANCWDIEFDLQWPVLSGILWPIAGPIAAAYIAARWYLNSEKE